MIYLTNLPYYNLPYYSKWEAMRIILTRGNIECGCTYNVYMETVTVINTLIWEWIVRFSRYRDQSGSPNDDTSSFRRKI